MSEKNLKTSVLDKIKQEGIKPVPRSTILLRRAIFWVLMALSVLIGAVAVAVVILHLRFNDWEFYGHFARSLPGYALKTLPYFWLIAFAAFAGFAYYNFRHTNKGYKYKFGLVLLASVGLSVLLGVVFHRAGVDHRVEKFLHAKLPAYERLSNARESRWAQPEEGFLAGRVLRRTDRGFRLEDLFGDEWDVVSEMSPRGEMVRMVGEKIEENVFKAERIQPWEGPQQRLKPKIREKMKEKMREMRSN